MVHYMSSTVQADLSQVLEAEELLSLCLAMAIFKDAMSTCAGTAQDMINRLTTFSAALRTKQLQVTVRVCTHFSAHTEALNACVRELLFVRLRASQCD